MLGKKGSKKGQHIEISDSAGVTGATDKIDHAFVADVKKPQRSQTGKKMRGLKWVILAAGLLILAGAGYLIWKQMTVDNSLKGNEYEKAKTKFVDLTDQANYLAGQNKSAQIIPKLEKYLQTPNLPDDLRKDALTQLATAYQNDKQYDKTISTYDELVKLEGHETATTAAGKAIAYQSKGDKANAISFYEQAITLSEQELKQLKKGDGAILTYRQQIVSYKITIKALKGPQ